MAISLNLVYFLFLRLLWYVACLSHLLSLHKCFWVDQKIFIHWWYSQSWLFYVSGEESSQLQGRSSCIIFMSKFTGRNYWIFFSLKEWLHLLKFEKNILASSASGKKLLYLLQVQGWNYCIFVRSKDGITASSSGPRMELLHHLQVQGWNYCIFFRSQEGITASSSGPRMKLLHLLQVQGWNYCIFFRSKDGITASSSVQRIEILHPLRFKGSNYCIFFSFKCAITTSS